MKEGNLFYLVEKEKKPLIGPKSGPAMAGVAGMRPTLMSIIAEGVPRPG